MHLLPHTNNMNKPKEENRDKEIRRRNLEASFLRFLQVGKELYIQK